MFCSGSFSKDPFFSHYSDNDEIFFTNDLNYWLRKKFRFLFIYNIDYNFCKRDEFFVLNKKDLLEKWIKYVYDLEDYDGDILTCKRFDYPDLKNPKYTRFKKGTEMDYISDIFVEKTHVCNDWDELRTNLYLYRNLLPCIHYIYNEKFKLLIYQNRHLLYVIPEFIFLKKEIPQNDFKIISLQNEYPDIKFTSKDEDVLKVFKILIDKGNSKDNFVNFSNEKITYQNSNNEDFSIEEFLDKLKNKSSINELSI